MDTFIKKFTEDVYRIPTELSRYQDQSSIRIVTAWYIIHTQTEHTHVSLQTVHESIDPNCQWDKIGTALNILFQKHDIPQDLQLLRPIGEGNTVVMLGHRDHCHLVAIKQQMFSRGHWEISSHMIHEMITLQRIQGSKWSPRIHFQKVFDNMIQIGMEYIPISFRQMVKFSIPKNMVHCRRIMVQLLRTVSELHTTYKVAHRDIKPDNIRFRSDGSLVLIDYDSCLNVTSNYRFTNRVCTSNYRDPFLFQHGSDKEYGNGNYNYFHLDAFSCGCVFLFILLGGKHAFGNGDDDEDIHSRMITYLDNSSLGGLPPLVASRLLESDRKVLRGLLDTNPSTRMTIGKAIDELQSIK
jgi:serine/threonine protein kinase